MTRRPPKCRPQTDKQFWYLRSLIIKSPTRYLSCSLFRAIVSSVCSVLYLIQLSAVPVCIGHAMALHAATLYVVYSSPCCSLYALVIRVFVRKWIRGDFFLFLTRITCGAPDRTWTCTPCWHESLNLTRMPISPQTHIKMLYCKQHTITRGRGDRTWTCGILVPNQALYQTEPHPCIYYIIYNDFKNKIQVLYWVSQCLTIERPAVVTRTLGSLNSYTSM